MQQQPTERKRRQGLEAALAQARPAGTSQSLCSDVSFFTGGKEVYDLMRGSFLPFPLFSFLPLSSFFGRSACFQFVYSLFQALLFQLFTYRFIFFLVLCIPSFSSSSKASRLSPLIYVR